MIEATGQSAIAVQNIEAVIDAIRKLAASATKLVLTIEALERIEGDTAASPAIGFLRRIIEEPDTIPISRFLLCAEKERSSRVRRDQTELDATCHRDGSGSGLYACPCASGPDLAELGTVAVGETCFSTPSARWAGMPETTVGALAGLPLIMWAVGSTLAPSSYSLDGGAILTSWG